jgi:hypothetical protein
MCAESLPGKKIPRGPNHTGRSEGGYVLIWSLFAFVLLGGLAAAVLKSTGAERRLAKASSEWNASFYAAEVGLQQGLSFATDTLIGALQPGDSVDLGWRPIDGATDYRAVIYRVDNGPHRLYQLRSTGRHAKLFGGQTTVTQTTTTASDEPAGATFKGYTEFRGNATLKGKCKIHADNGLHVGGSLTTDGIVSSTGNITGTITYQGDGGPEPYSDAEDIEPWHAKQLCDTADYQVSGGTVTANATGDSLSGIVFKANSGDYELSVQPPAGSYCVNGTLTLAGAIGSAAAPAQLSLFVLGFVNITGNPFIEASHPSDVVIAAEGDIFLNGVRDSGNPNYRGRVLGRNQCDAGGNPRLEGSLECEDQTQWSDEDNAAWDIVPDNIINGDLELVTVCGTLDLVVPDPIALRSWRHDY